jgi:AcrR family transcriptional regulator
MANATGEQGETKRLGRPPRVSTAQIAEAALAIGLERATIRNVADYLGMSVPGLYHHVRTRDDLLAIAAAHSLGELPLPEDHGQPWTEWLLEYGRFVYEALIAQPELIGQILAGTYNTMRMAQHLERLLEVLVGHGFTVDEAYAAYGQLSGAVTGAAASEIGRRATIQAGHPRLSDLGRAAKALGAETVPLVEELLRVRRSSQQLECFDTVRLVIDGVAATRSLK